MASTACLLALGGASLVGPPASSGASASPAAAAQDAASFAKPTSPTQVAARRATGGVRVTWKPVTASPPITRYVVHAGQGSCPVTVSAGATSAVLPVIAGQRVIEPRVEAVNSYGFSAPGVANSLDVSGRATTRFQNLQILQLSDFHGAIQASPTAAGGPVLAAAWQRDRARVPATITVSSGDNIGGAPPVSSLFEEFPTIEALNLMGMDASTIGNHEHDRPLEHFRRVVDASSFRWVASNYSSLKPLAGSKAAVRDLLMIRRSGLTVGIVGMNTEDTPEAVSPGNLVDPDTGDEVGISASTRGVQRAIRTARDRGADVVIVLAHQGWSQNVAGRPKGRLVQVARHLRGGDVVFGGHTHQEFNSYVRNTLVAQVPNSGYAYSRTQVCFDRLTERVVGADTEMITVEDLVGVTPDPGVQAVVDRYVSQAEELLDVRVGVVAGVFPRGGEPPVERSEETPMGTFAAETVRAAYGTQLSFLNGGGIRDTLPASKYTPGDLTLRRPSPGSSGPYDVTLGDLLSVFPFGNNAATSRISGVDLWWALENGVSGYPASGKFPQIAGFRFSFDPSRPVGERVLEVTLPDGTPLPPDEVTYTVATVDYMVYGGDGYGDAFRPSEAVIRRPYVDDIADAIARNFRAGEVTAVPEPDGRIRLTR
jgi:2',3'-cyclic-nucleotide 2'-phosphodiesterase (5'-nucleotidase family)